MTMGVKLGRQIFLCLILIITVSCTATQPPKVLAPSGWPAGWSADGSQLLIAGYGGYRARIVSLSDNSLPPGVSSVLTRTSSTCVAWASNGKTLLYIEPDPKIAPFHIKYQLYRVDLPGQPTSIWEWDDSVSCPAWSPDNQYIAIVAEKNDRDTLYILNRDGRIERALLTSGGMWEPVWSPDGRTIAIPTSWEITLVDSETGEKITPPVSLRGGVDPTWSPTGEYMAYIEPDMISPRHFGNLMIAKLDGTRTIVLAGAKDKTSPKDDEFFYQNPSWSPRGDYIAVRRIRATEHDFQRDERFEVVLIPVPDDVK